jgi:hypothetical protein
VYNGRIFNSTAVILKTLNWFVINSISLRTDTTFGNSCNINACDAKYDGNSISGLAFVRGTLFDPAISGLLGRYPTGQGITLFEVRWSP